MRHFTLIAALIITTSLFAQGGPNQQGGGHHRGQGGYLTQELNLTPEQHGKLVESRDKSALNIKPIREEIRALRGELIKNYSNPKKVDSLATKLGDAHKRLSLLTNKQLIEVSKILTKEQMSKFIEVRLNHKRGGSQGGKHQGKGNKNGKGHGQGYSNNCNK